MTVKKKTMTCFNNVNHVTQSSGFALNIVAPSIAGLAGLLCGQATKPSRFAHFWHGAQSQKWSEHVVFLTCWLWNVLHATTACTFSTPQLPKAVRTCCALYILTWKCASRHNDVHFFDISGWSVFSLFTCKCASHHNGVYFFDISTSISGPRMVLYILTSKCASGHNSVQLFISHLARWLRTRCFSEPTFPPSGATRH